MCRLLGIAAPAPMTIVEAVGATTLTDLQGLARLHSDGWGLAWQGDSGPEVEMHAESGADLADRVGGVTTEAAIVHLRWASVGKNLPENTHPFLDQGVAFAHNGTITPASLLDDLLSDAVRPGITGTTDSERYFALVRHFVLEGRSLPHSFWDALQVLRPLFPTASLNALAMDEFWLVAVNANSGATLPEDRIDRCRAAGIDGEHNDDYFGLKIATAPSGAVVVGSTGFGELDWRPLPPESITAIRLSDLVVQTFEI
ncbi:MAG TPA: class II glutamine amidotransferase [Propionibacteriaceae bacterium]|nr:class II glutamine amidotransferase [Propionibacteriaceae bacterium]